MRQIDFVLCQVSIVAARGVSCEISLKTFPPALWPLQLMTLHYKYILQFRQIQFAIKTNIFCTLDKYILHFRQIHFVPRNVCSGVSCELFL